MVQLRSRLMVRDNTGVKVLRRIQVKGIGQSRSGSMGHTRVASVLKARPDSSFKKGDLVRAILVTSKSGWCRPSGVRLRFAENGAVLIDKKGEPIGTRIHAALPTDLRRRGLAKVLSRSSHVV